MKKLNKKVVLYILTEKGLEVFRYASKYYKNLIDYVVVGADTNVANDYSADIINLAKISKINYFTKGNEPLIDDNKYVFAISWRWMINHPQNKLIVFHDSILPKYRGFAPLVNMLINGEKEIGVSAIFGASEYDKGDLIAQKQSKIHYPITIANAIDINKKNFIALADVILHKILKSETIIGIPQDESEASYSIWRDKDDYLINWNTSASNISRFIDAVGMPYSGALTQTSSGEIIKVLKAEVIDDVYCEHRHVGKVIFIQNGEPTIICREGLLKITEAYTLISAEEIPLIPMKKFREKFI